MLCLSVLRLDNNLKLWHADPFLEPTGNVSDAFANEITPSGWTFIIWTIIYIFLALVCVYALSGFFRKCVTIFNARTMSYLCSIAADIHNSSFYFCRNAYGYVYCSPALLPHGFFAAWCLNLSLNVGWLFLWDRRCAPQRLFSPCCSRKRCQTSHNNCVDSPGWWLVLWSSSS